MRGLQFVSILLMAFFTAGLTDFVSGPLGSGSHSVLKPWQRNDTETSSHILWYWPVERVSNVGQR